MKKTNRPNFTRACRGANNGGSRGYFTVDGFTWLTEYTLNYKRAERKTCRRCIGGRYLPGISIERLFTFALDFPDNRTGLPLARQRSESSASNGESSWGIISYLSKVNYTPNDKMPLHLTHCLDGRPNSGKTANTVFSLRFCRLETSPKLFSWAYSPA